MIEGEPCLTTIVWLFALFVLGCIADAVKDVLVARYKAQYFSKGCTCSMTTALPDEARPANDCPVHRFGSEGQ